MKHPRTSVETRRVVRREVVEPAAEDETTIRERVVVEEPEGTVREVEVRPVGEVVTTEVDPHRARVAGFIAQVVGFVFFLIYLLLGVRLVLSLLGANPDVGFARWIVGVSQPLYSPFQGLLPRLVTDGFVLELSLLFALGIYALAHYAIVRLLRLVTYRRTAV